MQQKFRNLPFHLLPLLSGQSKLLNETITLVFQNHLYLITEEGKKSSKQKNVQTFPSKSLKSGCCLKGGGEGGGRGEAAFSGLGLGLVLIILTIKPE